MSTPKSAAIYVRISKDSQGKGLGVQRQKELCEKLVTEKGWTVGETYTDNDLSAYTGKPRPGFETMLADIESGERDGVVVVDQDRLLRRMVDLTPLVEIAEDRGGLPIAMTQGDLDLATTDGIFRAQIMVSVAEQESRRKKDRVKRQKDQSATNGWWQGGARPYGYESTRTEDGYSTLEVKPEEAEIVIEMAERVMAGESLRSIATDLNDRGATTSRGSKWRVSTIRSTLTNSTIAGLRTHRGEVIGEANWPGILDRVTWERVRATLDSRGNGKRGRPSNHLLTGLLKCHKCGGTLWARNHKETARYVCVKQANNDHCGGTSINAEPLETFITDVAVRALESFAPQVDIPVTDAKATTDEIAEIEARMDRLATLHFVEGEMSEREYLTARNGLEAKIAKLRAELGESTTMETFEVQDHRELWEGYTLNEKRKALSLAIDHIVVLPGNRWTSLPDRLETHFTNGKVA